MNSALLVMDVQNGIVERIADQATPLMNTMSSAIRAARAADLPIIFVRVAFREGAPEISPRNKSFAAIAGADRMTESGLATQIHPAVCPAPGDVLITKRRVSSFSGSDLDVVLRSRGIDSLVLTGIATSGVVLSTTRQAADLDFTITVLSDACADLDDEVHRVLM